MYVWIYIYTQPQYLMTVQNLCILQSLLKIHGYVCSKAILSNYLDHSLQGWGAFNETFQRPNPRHF